MFTIISYDIIDDKRRLKIAKYLENYATRVHHSVFEAHIDKQQFDKIYRELIALIKQDEDSIRIYQLCNACIKKIKICGTGEITKDEEVYII